MMLALILAQLVLPWPGLDSPLVQPPGMICASGDCSAGPVIYGAAERGRLVVACDMRSATCSDGRQITTTRSTPVPCETSPGVWEMVPEDTACISYRGLESWAANTSYLSWGAELDRSPWGPSARGGSLTQIDDGWRVYNNPAEPNSGWMQRVIGDWADETWTTSYILRTWYPILLATYAGTSQSCGHQTLDTQAKWETFSCTRQVLEPSDPAAMIFPGGNTTGTAHYVDVRAAWTVQGATPGRACWGGEAPVTCAADRHTISTEGWPTESGEISLVYTPQDVGIGSAMYLAATTGGGANQPSGFYLYRISASGALVFGLRRGDTTSAQATQDLAWENGRSYHVRVRWSPERAEIWRDGVHLRSWVPTTVPDSHPGTAVIGTTIGGASPAQGSIRAFTVRSYEEVSP